MRRLKHRAKRRLAQTRAARRRRVLFARIRYVALGRSPERWTFLVGYADG